MAEAMVEGGANQTGSTTQTVQLVKQENADEGVDESEQTAATEAPTLTLRLRPRPSVTWGADVINNEGMGKKSSKRE